ncbi:hypothetical protein [Paenibacillus glycinis]|uniref:Uncharacterized protein n=1 Tax=Paenibacillus glycinis TaxID=2697035 RepID=A0ABW9XIF7_9BACL|nr:hypothetical protein [Paenibacillus glycinis]NBD22331.1 hypothetical protein [Paenibacillus glycinis]
MIIDVGLYAPVKRIKDGLQAQRPIFAEMTSFLKDTFGYDILCCGYLHERIEGERPYFVNRLDIYANDNETYGLMMENGFNVRYNGQSSTQETEALHHFLRLAAEHRVPHSFPLLRHPRKYASLLLKDTDKLYIDTKQLFPICHSFEDAYKGNLLNRNADELKALIVGRFPDRWIYRVYVSSERIYVFYDTIRHEDENDANGTTEEIKNLCHAYIRSLDEYGYFNQTANLVQTDSDEIVKQRYGGNYYYYFK